MKNVLLPHQAEYCGRKFLDYAKAAEWPLMWLYKFEGDRIRKIWCWLIGHNWKILEDTEVTARRCSFCRKYEIVSIKQIVISWGKNKLS